MRAVRQPYNHGIVCHTGLLDKPTSISSYSRSPESTGVYAQVGIAGTGPPSFQLISNPNPSPGPGPSPSSNPKPSPSHYQSPTRYSVRQARQPRFRHLLTALDAQCRAAHNNLPSSGSQVIGNSLFDSFAHRISLPHPSTGNRDVVFTEMAYLLGHPCVLVRLLAVRWRVVFWHARVQLDVLR